MVDERIMTRFDRIRMEARSEGLAEGEAKGLAEGMLKVARNLLKAGISKDIIVQTTGLTIADIEKQSLGE